MDALPHLLPLLICEGKHLDIGRAAQIDNIIRQNE